MRRLLMAGITGILLSNVVVASDWKSLPNGNAGFYSENKSIGSQVILSDITTGTGIMEVSLLTINPKCTTGRGSKGITQMYINATLVKLGYICTQNGDNLSIYFGASEKDKDYIYNEFTHKAKVCFSFKKDIKGACFNAIGFDDASTKLSKIIVDRSKIIVDRSKVKQSK